MGRGNALDVAFVHRSLGFMANPSSSSERLPTYGSCNRSPAHARVASGITTSVWFQVSHSQTTFSFLQQNIISSEGLGFMVRHCS